MHMRSISHTIHMHSNFYAHNVSIIPIYNKIFSDSRTKYKPDGYEGKGCYIDPDLPIYRNNWIEFNAKALCAAYDISDFIAINMSGVSISITEWFSLDMLLREAIKIAFNEAAKEENKKQMQMKSDLEQKMEASKPYQSAFSGVTKPTFIN